MTERRRFNYKNQIPVIIGLLTIAGVLIGAGRTFSESLNKIESNTTQLQQVIPHLKEHERRLNKNDIEQAERKKDIEYIKEGITEIKDALKDR